MFSEVIGHFHGAESTILDVQKLQFLLSSDDIKHSFTTLDLWRHQADPAALATWFRVAGCCLFIVCFSFFFHKLLLPLLISYSLYMAGEAITRCLHTWISTVCMLVYGTQMRWHHLQRPITVIHFFLHFSQGLSVISQNYIVLPVP